MAAKRGIAIGVALALILTAWLVSNRETYTPDRAGSSQQLKAGSGSAADGSGKATNSENPGDSSDRSDGHVSASAGQNGSRTGSSSDRRDGNAKGSSTGSEDPSGIRHERSDGTTGHRSGVNPDGSLRIIVRVHAVDGNSVPISGHVDLWYRGKDPIVRSLDEEGRCTFEFDSDRPAKGFYQSYRVDLFYGGAITRRQVTVTGDQPEVDVEFVIDGTLTLSGSVQNLKQLTYDPELFVELSMLDAESRLSGKAWYSELDASGGYSIAGIPAGHFVLSIAPLGHFEPFELTQSTLYNIVLPDTELSGIVRDAETGAPIEDATVSLSQVLTGEPLSLFAVEYSYRELRFKTESDARFLFASFASGRYAFVVWADGYTNHREQIEIVSDTDHRNIEVSMRREEDLPSGELKFNITDVNGKPINPAWISHNRMGGISEKIDMNATVYIAPGIYNFYVYHPDVAMGVIDNVEVLADSVTTRSIRMEAAAPTEIRIRRTSGEAAAGVRFVLFKDGQDLTPLIRPGASVYGLGASPLQADEQGIVLVNWLPSGAYRLLLREPGYQEIDQMISLQIGIGTMDLTLVDSDSNWYVVVTEIAPGSDADRAGIQVGDLIVEYNGQLVTGNTSVLWLETAATELQEGGTVDVVIERNGQKILLQIAAGFAGMRWERVFR